MFPARVRTPTFPVRRLERLPRPVIYCVPPGYQPSRCGPSERAVRELLFALRVTEYEMFIPVMLWASSALVMAQAVPTINVEPHCRLVARNASPAGDVESCVKSEERARDQLVAQWRQFSGPDKQHCLRLSRLGVEATYTELLTCLELARDVRKLREQGHPK
jgi:hypothetical protein